MNDYSSWLLERVPLNEVVRLRFGITTIGRNNNSTIAIKGSTYVSRNHAEIEVSADNKKITIRDLKSVNGIFVNDNNIEEEIALLKVGDRIGIGVICEDEDDENDVNLPIYQVQYIPIKRVQNQPHNPEIIEPNALTQAVDVGVIQAKNNAQNSNEASTSNASIVKREALPSCSSPNRSFRSTPPIACIILSDDDDDDDDNEDEEKKKREEEKRRIIGRQDISNTDGTLNPAKDLPKLTAVVSNIDDSMITRLTPPPSNTSNCSSDSDSQQNSNKPTASKESDVHCPIIPAIKREIARNTSAEIISLFGGTDEVILNKMKSINPYCYNDLNGKPMHMPTTLNGRKPLCDGDLISLSSDEEDNENENGNRFENLGQIFVNEIDHQMDHSAKTTTKRTACSPNIFDSSLNSSKDKNEDPPQQEQIMPTSTTTTTDNVKTKAVDKPKEILDISTASTTVNEKLRHKKPNAKKTVVENTEEAVTSSDQIKEKPKEAVTGSDNAKEIAQDNPSTKSIVATDNSEDYNTYEPRSDDEDIEELMFSQVIIGDMKAEMANDFDNEANEEDNSRDIITPYISMLDNEAQSSVSANSTGAQSAFDSSCWLLSDDETDEEQDTKVCNWKKKIFSQSFSTLSQAHEESIVYDYNGQENDQIMEDDDEETNDTDTDLYNRIFADPDKVCDDVIDLLQEQDSCSSKLKADELDYLDVESNNDLESAVIKQISATKKRVAYNSDNEQEKTTSTCKNIKLDSPLIMCRNKKPRRVISTSDDEQDKDDRKKPSKAKIVGEQEKLDCSESHTKENQRMDQQPSKQINEHKSLKRPEKHHTSKKKSISDLNQRKDRPSTSNNVNARRISEQPEKVSNENVQALRRKSHDVIKRTSIDAEVPALMQPEKPKENSAPTSENKSTEVGAGVATKTVKRGPPMIIDAPQLPRFKGKLRGVSAATGPYSPSTGKSAPNFSKRVHSLNELEKKVSAVRQNIRQDQTIKELKQKWEKPNAAPKHNSEHKVNIKKRLKDLSDKQKQEREKKESLKRKMSTDEEHNKIKKPKVKLTTANRGAFLVEEYKIPKIKPRTTTNPKDAASAIISSANAVLDGPSTSKAAAAAAASVRPINSTAKSLSSANNAVTTGSRFAAPSTVLHRQTSAEKQQLGTFSQQLAMADNIPAPAAVAAAPVQRNEATKARAQRTTNKITFASMQKNFIESHQNRRKLDTIVTNRSCLSDELSSKRSKKTVRFNDIPIVHYIECVRGACKKVDKKDIEPRSSYYDRCMEALGSYKQIDCTNEIISLILRWSNEFLLKGSAAVDGVGDIIYHVPNYFSSFDHYKSIIFPLMKLEFLNRLQREFNERSAKPVNVFLENASENNDRWRLAAQFNCENVIQWDSTKIDVVTLDFGIEKTFAYLSNRWKGSGSCRYMMFEVIGNHFSRDFFKSLQKKVIHVRPVLDDVRVEFGAFNAVYQLEQTPLFRKILNPLELLKCEITRTKKKLSNVCDPYLNDKQREVLLNTDARAADETTPNITLVEGPPGTGKSVVISNLAMQALYGDDVRTLDKKILICAQSNVAVDVIAQKLLRMWSKMSTEKKFRIVRFGIFEKINAKVTPISLKKLVEKEQLKKLQSYNSNIQIENEENMRKQMLELEAEIAEMKTRNIKGTVQEDELIEKQRQLQLMRNITTHTLRPEDERSLHQHFLRNANIVCATLSSCVKLSQFVKYFDICIIDEATQCTEPYTLLPLKFFINSLVLVGDTKQLPATVLSKKASECGLASSLFTRIQRCLDTVKSSKSSSGTGTTQTMDLVTCGLKTQYRMHPEICKWPNSYFYKNELLSAKSTGINTKIVPFSILNLSYSQDAHCAKGQIKNNNEAAFVAKLLKALDGYIPTKYNTYGVITPYANHRDTLANSIKCYGLTNIMVNTIDSYQGVEKDVIIISNARTSGVGFLANHRRLNVALTRPKRCLILCGNFKNLESVPAWSSLLKNARERNLFHEISATCDQDIQRNVIEKIMVKKH